LSSSRRKECCIYFKWFWRKISIFSWICS